jgi:hypothetical protein
VGDDVEIGQVIAIGGSTGISTGNHLHLEVRKDGETVDPLHVLPADDGDTTAFDIDCATTPFTLPSGSQALLDFAGVLADDERVIGVIAVPLSGGPELDHAVQDRSRVILSSVINFHGPDGLDSYELEVTAGNAANSQVFNCALVVQQREVPTTFYVRTFTPSDDVALGPEGAPVAATAAPPSPTPTPHPWAQTPDYEVSTSPGGGAQPPSYAGPTSSGASVQTPSYGVTGPTPSATPTPVASPGPAPTQ